MALDAASGAPCADFGKGGEVSLRDVQQYDAGWYHMTSPPAVMDDLVIVGSAIDDNHRVDMARGMVRAFDARTGALRWSWDPRLGANDLRIRLGQNHDAEALARLINAAFRVEQPFIEGDRINLDGVRAYMEKGMFLLAEDSAGLAGCVYIEIRGARGYLGLLGVDPPRQGTGRAAD